MGDDFPAHKKYKKIDSIHRKYILKNQKILRSSEVYNT